MSNNDIEITFNENALYDWLKDKDYMSDAEVIRLGYGYNDYDFKNKIFSKPQSLVFLVHSKKNHSTFTVIIGSWIRWNYKWFYGHERHSTTSIEFADFGIYEILSDLHVQMDESYYIKYKEYFDEIQSRIKEN